MTATWLPAPGPPHPSPSARAGEVKNEIGRRNAAQAWSAASHRPYSGGPVSARSQTKEIWQWVVNQRKVSTKAGDHRASDLNPQAASHHRSGEMTKTVITPAHDGAPVMVRKNFTGQKTKMCDATPTNKNPCFLGT